MQTKLNNNFTQRIIKGFLVLVMLLSTFGGAVSNVSAEGELPIGTVDVNVTPGNQWVQAYEWSSWPTGTNLTLKVNDVELSTVTMGSSFWDPNVQIAFFDLNNQNTLQIGDIVTVTDGITSVAVPISGFRVTNVDVDADTISGWATPNASVAVAAGSDWLHVTADSSGNWSANFQPRDIKPGDNGSAGEYSNPSGYIIWYDWNVPGPITQDIPIGTVNVNVTPGNQWIQANEWLGWPTGTSITLKVNDVELSTIPIGPSFWDPSVLVAFFGLNNQNTLQIGDIVTVTDGITSVAVPISGFRVTNVDVDADTISGWATPNANVGVAAGSNWQSITADSSGNWTANFQPLDIKTGDNGFALEYSNPSGYHIQYDWNAPIDSDFDGIDDSIDNAPNTYNPDQRNIDNDGYADVVDPCPSDPINTCNESGSISEAVSPEGGTLIPPNNAIVVQLPAGALTKTTSMSITDNGSGYAVTTDQGQVITVNSADIGPAGTVFVTPITITLNWSDADNNGIVDNTSINEDELIISKDGFVVAGPCNESVNCDKELNSYSIQVSSLSYFVLGAAVRPPVISSISAPVSPVQLGLQVNTSAEFSYTGGTDSLNAVWSWDDGTTSNGIITDNTVSGEHNYSSPGVYTVKLQITDNGGETGDATFQYIVIYDPEGGFVSGGGWINSPPGAYIQDPSMVGKATFGFTSTYKKGASVPTGNTEFHFQTANFKFSSISYDWLVVAGSKAQFKGKGTINGSGNYGFMLTAVDGQPDRFRIKIWNISTNTIYYDNMLGTTDDSIQVTALGGGSVVIHK